MEDFDVEEEFIVEGFDEDGEAARMQPDGWQDVIFVLEDDE